MKKQIVTFILLLCILSVTIAQDVIHAPSGKIGLGWYHDLKSVDGRALSPDSLWAKIILIDITHNSIIQSLADAYPFPDSLNLREFTLPPDSSVYQFAIVAMYNQTATPDTLWTRLYSRASHGYVPPVPTGCTGICERVQL